MRKLFSFLVVLTLSFCCFAGCSSSEDDGEVGKSVSIDALPFAITCGDLSVKLSGVSYAQDSTDSGFVGYVLVTFDRTDLDDDLVQGLFYRTEDRTVEKLGVRVYGKGANAVALDCIGSVCENDFLYFAFQTNELDNPAFELGFSIQIISVPEKSILDASTSYFYYNLVLSAGEDYSFTSLDSNTHDELSKIISKFKLDQAWEASQWTVEYFVDDFGDKTDSSYVRSKMINGSFSNTATTNSTLSVYVYYEPGDYIKFRLFEYGSHKATHLSSETISLAFKVDGETHYMMLKSENSLNGDIYASSKTGGFDILKKALISEELFPCVIKIGSTSEYHFSIDGTGFLLALNEMNMN